MVTEQCLPPPRIPGRRAPAARRVVQNQVGTNTWLSCIALVLDNAPSPPLPAGTVFARTCYPVQVTGRANGTSPLDPLDPAVFNPGDVC